MPTSNKVKKKLLQHLPDIKAGRVVELGAGWGNLAIPLARRYPHLTIEAYEASWVPYLFLKGFKTLCSTPNLKVIRINFFKISLQPASLCVCYLYPGAMQKLKNKFENELSDEAYVVSNTFSVPQWKPTQEIIVNDLFQTRIFLYKRGDARGDLGLR
jgi:16S rRNA A1518/A1519 N6-dimethyltransferase RsmA/KsgA/DIM1 with predicted DNA glycosylase/AP lyase activity